MKTILSILVAIYGGLMELSSILALFQTTVAPAYILILTALAGAILLAGIAVPNLIPVGIIFLLIVTLANGFILYGRPHWSHLLVRGTLSVVILVLWWFAFHAKR